MVSIVFSFYVLKSDKRPYDVKEVAYGYLEANLARKLFHFLQAQFDWRIPRRIVLPMPQDGTYETPVGISTPEAFSAVVLTYLDWSRHPQGPICDVWCAGSLQYFLPSLLFSGESSIKTVSVPCRWRSRLESRPTGLLEVRLLGILLGRRYPQSRLKLEEEWACRVLNWIVCRLTCYERKVRVWRQRGWWDVRKWYGPQQRSLVRDIGERMHVRIDCVLVYLARPIQISHYAKNEVNTVTYLVWRKRLGACSVKIHFLDTQNLWGFR